MSKRGAEVAIISIAQQARPNRAGQTELARARFKTLSRLVVTTPPIGDALRYDCTSPGITALLVKKSRWLKSPATLELLLPVKSTLAPQVDVAKPQHQQEKAHFNQAKKF